MHSRSLSLLLLGLVLGLNSQVSIAAALDKAKQTLAKAQQQAVIDQQAINQLDNQAQAAHQQYLDALRQADLLDAYNLQLEQLTRSQQVELSDVRQQIMSLEQTELTVLPLLNQMQSSLRDFVAADLPFLPTERKTRLEMLDDVIVRADISLAEKYRQLLNAYQIEAEYGRTLDTYQGSLTDKNAREVNFIRLGRVALYYQTLDGRESGLWDAQLQKWQRLPSQHNAVLQTAMRLAKQQVVPELLALPLPQVNRTENLL